MARQRRRQIPAAEWIASLIGGAIVLVTVVFLAFEAFQGGDETPALHVTVVHVREAAGSFVVDVEVRNESRSAAAEVHLAGSSDVSGPQAMQAQASLDFVPGFSTRHASLVFASDPGANPVVRVVGYSRP